MMPMNLSFRRDIEGLRAVAVLMVLAYHAHVPGITGGFVGVDVFFVISGFLITRLIARELVETGRVSFAAFYARRIRRLLPASMVVIAVTVVASIVLLPAIRIPGILDDGSAAALYIANIRFAAEATDYLQAGEAPSPLLHYWSVGVEEHFYLFWPAILALAWRFGSGVVHGVLAARLIVVVVAVTAIASFVVSVWLTGADAPLAFYLLPARAWELAAGGLVALIVDGAAGPIGLSRFVPSRLLNSRRAAEALALVGIGLVGIAGVRFDDTTAFPGWIAIVPVMGIVLVLGTGGSQPATLVHRVLAIGRLRWIGRISYSLYLVHWPLLTLPAQALGHTLPGPVRLALVALAFPLAALSERFVERPIRTGGVLAMRPGRTVAIAGLAGLVMAVTLSGFGGGLIAAPAAAVAGATETPPPLVLPSAPIATSPPAGASGAPSPNASASPNQLPATKAGPVPPDLIPPLAEIRDSEPVIYHDGCHVPPTATTSEPCVYGDARSPTTIVLIGDSHAAQWFPTVEAIAIEHGWRLEVMTKSACPAADVSLWNSTLKRSYHECEQWRAATLDRIAREHPALVVASNTRYVNLMVDGERVPAEANGPLWEAALSRTLQTLKGSAGSVVLLSDTPDPKVDPADCLARHVADALACATPWAEAVSPRLAADRSLSATLGVDYVDPTPWVCPSDPCPVVIDRYAVFRDAGHLTVPFALALAPYLDAALPPIP
jgi:peptidoglycan/LPS O-acetylase OafA/YrhL